MAFETDPYRTLGVSRDASLDEVKRAYRRLAKANHPDAAGEAALPRFLAIQAAYERIAGPGAARADGLGRRTGPPRRPWDADPARADATRRAYGGRRGRTRPTPPGGAPRRADERSSGAGAGTPPASEGGTTSAGQRSRPDGAGTTGGSSRESRRRRATLGSTSYDEADKDPFEPDWGGASWYGTTSGTYWTINPREYADPRKHGPEYQARARRGRASAPGGIEPPEGVEPPGGAEPPGGSPDAPDRPTQRARNDPASAPRHTISSWWDATTGEAPPATAPPERRGGRSSDGPPPTGPRSTGGDTGDSSFPGRATLLAWLDADDPSLVVRVGRAVIGWAPIALGLGWVAGEMTGCARFSATCDAGSAPIAWLAQLTILALLLIVPMLARLTSIATVATLAAAVPGTLILSAAGGSNDEAAGRPLLGGLLVIAWVVGFAYALARLVRDRTDEDERATSGPAPPDGHVS